MKYPVMINDHGDKKQLAGWNESKKVFQSLLESNGHL